MNQVLYFLKDAHRLAEQMDPAAPDPFHRVRDALTALGFGPVIDQVEGNGTLFPVMSNGPGGSDGAILTSWPKGKEPDLIGYFPSRQTWTQVRPEVWVGMAADSAVTPEALDNGNPWRIPGIPMKLADGQFWTVPVIRRADSHFLPTELYHDVSGKLVTPIKARFLTLWNESGYCFDKSWESLMSEGEITIDLKRSLQFACDVIALRYRWTLYTQSALRIIDENNVFDIVRTAIGWDVVTQKLREWRDPNQKKSLNCA